MNYLPVMPLILIIALLCGCATQIKDAKTGQQVRHLDRTAAGLQEHAGYNEWLDTRISALAAEQFRGLMIAHWGKIVAGLLALERGKKLLDDRRKA